MSAMTRDELRRLLTATHGEAVPLFASPQLTKPVAAAFTVGTYLSGTDGWSPQARCR